MEIGGEKAGILWEKVRRVGKRGGNSTPAASVWRTTELGVSANSVTGYGRLHETFGIISSRKLAAALWELHHYRPPLDNTRRRVTVPPLPLRRLNRSPTFQLPESSSYLRRHVAESLMQHHRSVETSNHATQTVSPSTRSSSMAIAPCYSATSSSSIELKGRNRELTYSLRISTELLKVLNRVWSLEKQYVSNMSLIKVLEKDLDRTCPHAKKSVRDELEQERKLRKQSESLQRELAQELYKMKSSVASISKQLEKERTLRGFLEDLCDELAWGVRDCEKELRDQSQKSDRDLGERDDHDRLLLHISRAWLDERMQVKQQQCNPMYQKSSLESIPLNLGARAHREEDDGDGSSSSHSICFEVEKTSKCRKKNHFEEMLKEKEFEEKLESSDRTRASSPFRFQAKFEEHMAKNQVKDGQGNPCEIVNLQKAEAVKNDIYGDKRETEGISELDSDSAINNLIRYYYSFSESGMQSNKDHEMASPLGRSFQSPLREWTEKLPAQDLDTSPSKFLPELKESTLREKLFEGRSGGQKSRSHQKAPIYPSRDE